MSWTLHITIALYALGLLHSIFGFYSKRMLFVRLALGMVGAGFLSHSLFLVLLGLERQHFPITSLPESLSFFAWCISLVFLVVQRQSGRVHSSARIVFIRLERHPASRAEPQLVSLPGEPGGAARLQSREFA